MIVELGQVRPAEAALPEEAYKSAVESLLTKPVEACSRYHGRLVAGVRFHPVVAAIHLAFNDHRPLVLSPDIFWLLMAQGFANHVNANAEELRPRFVKHPGKVVIAVRRDDFCKGSPENPWPEVFDEFTGQIREHLGAATHDLLLPAFSTTGVVERAAAQVALLDAMRSFFSYECRTLCGIPQIVLEGTADDWDKLAERSRALGRFGLEWWTRTVAPILDEFVAAAHGKVNLEFWQSIYKLDGGSGGPYITGWITAFFPYLKNWETGRATTRNSGHTNAGKEFQGHGLTTDAFPVGLAAAPFLWKYLGHSYEMEFLGGFVGVSQDRETLRLRPEIGWAVRDLSVIRSLEAAEVAAEADLCVVSARATERRLPCSYCGDSGDCFCKRKSSGSPDQCARCRGSGKCHMCQGSHTV